MIETVRKSPITNPFGYWNLKMLKNGLFNGRVLFFWVKDAEIFAVFLFNLVNDLDARRMKSKFNQIVCYTRAGTSFSPIWWFKLCLEKNPFRSTRFRTLNISIASVTENSRILNEKMEKNIKMEKQNKSTKNESCLIVNIKIKSNWFLKKYLKL